MSPAPGPLTDTSDPSPSSPSPKSGWVSSEGWRDYKYNLSVCQPRRLSRLRAFENVLRPVVPGQGVPKAGSARSSWSQSLVVTQTPHVGASALLAFVRVYLSVCGGGGTALPPSPNPAERVSGQERQLVVLGSSHDSPECTQRLV